MKAPRVCALCEATSAGALVKFRRRDICTWCADDLAARGLAWCTRCRRKVRANEIVNGMTCCRVCNRARQTEDRRDASARGREWRAANAEHRAAYDARADVRARRARSARDRYWRNPDAAREKSRRMYARYRAAKIAYARQWRAANRQRSRQQARLGYQRRKLMIWRRAA